ncbi:MAG: SBBP repeat-containing protein [Bacteroidales bacterium]|nr:SBBP repeat-containing protein [Bacteroidales bacterium]
MYSQAFQWATQSGGAGVSSSSDKGAAVAVDAQNNVFMTGTFEGTANFGTTTLTSAGGLDIFVEKRNADGVFQWAVQAGGTLGDYPVAIATDLSGNVFITGNFSGTATFGSTSITASSIDVFVAKYNNSGQFQWVKKAGGSSVDRGLGIAADISGNVIVTGDFSGTATFGTSTTLTSAGAVDIFMAKYNASGTLVWAKRAGGSVNDRATAVVTDDLGNIYITGSFGGTSNFGGTNITATGGAFDTDIFTAKYNNSGDLVWVKKGGTTGGDVEEAKSISIDSSDNVYIGGVFFGTVNFDGQTMSSNGSSDAFVAKYNNAGTIQWVRNSGGTLEDETASVDVTPDGSVCVTGFFKGSMSAGTFNLSAFSGVTDIDGFIVKLSPNGQFLWAKRLGRVNEDKSAGIAVDNMGRINACGFFRTNILFDFFQLSAQGSSDAFLTQLNDFITIDSLFSHTYCAGDSLFVAFSTSVSFNGSNVFSLELSDGVGSFANPVVIGSLLSDTSGIISALIPDSLNYGSDYRFRILASDFVNLGNVYFNAITINEKPPMPIPTSQTVFCQGDTVSCTTVNGQNSFWFSDLLLSNQIASGLTLNINQVLINDSTFYAVSISPENCHSDIAVINILIKPLPNIIYTGQDTTVICENASPIMIDILPSGGVFSGNGISAPNTFTPSVAQSGFHEIEYTFTDTNSCSSLYELFFDVLEAPVAMFDTNNNIQIPYYDTLFLSGSPAGGTFSGTGVTADYFVGEPNDGCLPCEVFYIYEAPNGCSDTAVIFVSNYVNNINEMNADYSFNVFPNPFNEELFIDFSNVSSYEITIYDALGKEVQKSFMCETDFCKINTSLFRKGMYLIRTRNDDKVLYQKIFKN